MEYHVVESDWVNDNNVMVHVVDTQKRYMNSPKYYGINVVFSRGGKVKDLVADGDDKVALDQIQRDRQKIIDVALEYYWKEESDLTENKSMKKNQLKILIKTILREICETHLNEWSSGNLPEYQIELDNVVLPGISEEKDGLIISVNIDYQYDEGSSERGQFGPSHKSTQASGAEVEIKKVSIVSVKVVDEQGKPKSEIDNVQMLTPDQKRTIEKSVNDYVDTHEDDISNEILDKQGDNLSSAEEDNYFDDRE
jgi:hypothetical protein